MKKFIKDIMEACYDSNRNDINPFDWFYNPAEDYAFQKERINKLKNESVKENKMSEVNLLSKVIKAITYLYRKDTLAPNVLVSELPNKQIYLSINRYTDIHNRSKKTIIFKSTKDNTEDVLMDAVKWLINQKKVSKNPIDELKELVNEDSNEDKPNYYPYGLDDHI